MNSKRPAEPGARPPNGNPEASPRRPPGPAGATARPVDPAPTGRKVLRGRSDAGLRGRTRAHGAGSDLPAHAGRPRAPNPRARGRKELVEIVVGVRFAESARTGPEAPNTCRRPEPRSRTPPTRAEAGAGEPPPVGPAPTGPEAHRDDRADAGLGRTRAEGAGIEPGAPGLPAAPRRSGRPRRPAVAEPAGGRGEHATFPAPIRSAAPPGRRRPGPRAARDPGPRRPRGLEPGHRGRVSFQS